MSTLAVIVLLRDLAEQAAAIANTVWGDTAPGHVNRAYHAGRSEAFTLAARIVEADQPQPTPGEPA